MPSIKPIKRKQLIKYLRQLGFQGPFAGGKHQFMQLGDLTLTIPNPHKSDIGPNFLKQILMQAGVSTADWEKL